MRPPLLRLSALLGLVIAGHAVAADCLAPSALAETFATRDRAYATQDPAGLATPIADPLRELLQLEFACRQDGEVCALDWDPWTDTVDGSAGATPTVQPGDEGATRASVRVAVAPAQSGAPAPARVSTLHFTRADAAACWQLADLDIPGHGSLVRLLTTVHH